MDGVAPSLWDCSARLPLAGGSRPAAILTRDREVPLSEERMVLYPNPPKTISPDDPCNNVSVRLKMQAGFRPANNLWCRLG